MTINPYRSPESDLSEEPKASTQALKHSAETAFSYLILFRWIAIIWCMYEGAIQLYQVTTNWESLADRSIISAALNPYFWLTSSLATIAVSIQLFRKSRWVFAALIVKIACYVFGCLALQKISILQTITTLSWLIQGILMMLCLQLWFKNKLR